MRFSKAYNFIKVSCPSVLVLLEAIGYATLLINLNRRRQRYKEVSLVHNNFKLLKYFRMYGDSYIIKHVRKLNCD